MAKQPSTRPWTRLAALRPESPPIPSPKAHQSPSQNVPTPSNSPSLKASHAPKISTIDDKNNNNAYHDNAKMQPQNHKNIKTTTPPSPKIELQSWENKKQFLVHDEKKVTNKEDETKEKGNVHKKISSNSEDSAAAAGMIRAITLAGENRGAFMEIIQSSKNKKPDFHHKKGNSKNNVHEYESEGNENGKKNKNHHKDRSKTIYSPTPFGAYINSNVQSSNNSLLYYTSCTSNDPGVQIGLSRKPYSGSESEGFHLKNNVKGNQNN